MDVREKLVELLREAASKTPPICCYDNPEEIEHFGKTITVYCKPFEQFQGLMRDAADYIAHGVTVQEWIPVNPCSCCGYGGKHLEAPPCTTCPAHPKEHKPNATLTGWISVKDRLPEMPPDKIAEGYVQMQVLVWCDKGRQCAWFQVDTKTFYDQPGLFGTKVDGVTHWMMLPQPPKGE